MKILMVHNFYWRRGGEDVSFENETALLREKNHEVIVYTQKNTDINQRVHAGTVWNMFWNTRVYRDIRSLIQRERPDIVHVHNFCWTISPSVFYAVRKKGVPVVFSFRNYRLMCPSALFYRGVVCEECHRRLFPFPSLKYACYQKNGMATFLVFMMLSLHKILGTWHKKIDAFIANTVFSKTKLVESGFDGSRIFIKPVLVKTETSPRTDQEKGAYAVFIGRLSEEKGIKTLLEAWRKKSSGLALKIIGEGDLSGWVKEYIQKEHLQSIELCGYLDQDRTLDMLAGAKFLLFPSEWYETFGRTIAEAFSCGVPVIASWIGAVEDVVTDQHDGLFFEPGDADDLAAKIDRLDQDEELLEKLSRNAYATFQKRYSRDMNYEILKDIYEKVISKSGGSFNNGKAE